jgi:hypothetical protein
MAESSQVGLAITWKLESALLAIDVRVLDHLVAGRNEIASFAEEVCTKNAFKPEATVVCWLQHRFTLLFQNCSGIKRSSFLTQIQF